MFKPRWRLLGVLIIGVVLLLYDLGGLSLSIDEYINVEIDRKAGGELLDALRQGVDRHPPLTHLVMSFWLRIVEENDVIFIRIKLVYQIAVDIHDSVCKRLHTLVRSFGLKDLNVIK